MKHSTPNLHGARQSRESGRCRDARRRAAGPGIEQFGHRFFAFRYRPDRRIVQAMSIVH